MTRIAVVTGASSGIGLATAGLLPLYVIGRRAPLVFALRRALPARVPERIAARGHGLRP